MTAPHDPSAGDPQPGFRSGSSPLPGYDSNGYPGAAGYPSSPVQYPATNGQYGAPVGQPGPYGAGVPDPAAYSPPPYGQSPYAAPGFGAPYPFGVAPRNGLGTAALVLGIIGVVLSWTVYLGVILGVLAIIFGGVGLARAKRGEATNRGAAMAGLVLGIIAIALLVLLVIIGIGLFAAGVSSSS